MSFDSTSSKTVTYEQPLNERIRTFMRIEELYSRFEYTRYKTSAIDTHFTVITLLEIMSLATRGDLKRELMKEVKRQITTLEQLTNIPSVDQNKLTSVIKDQEELISILDTHRGQLWANLKDNDFINSIKQRVSIPGGTCEFDLPSYHHWLTLPASQRAATLQEWIEPFDVIHKTTSKCLQLIRESAQETSEQAHRGFFQRNLDPSQPNQIIRVTVDESMHCFPEISAGKHRFSLRFMTQNSANETPKQLTHDVPFMISVCAF